MNKRDNLNKYSPEEILSFYHQEGDHFVNTAEKLGVYYSELRKYFEEHNLFYKKDIHKVCDNSFFSRDNEQSYYWAGFLASDGNLNKPQIALKLSSRDKIHLEKFKNDIKSDAVIYTETIAPKEMDKATRYTSAIHITSKQMVSDLQRFNIGPRKSLTYQFPTHLLENENIRHFIRGMIDGDGWVCLEGNKSNIELCGTKSCVEETVKHLTKILNLPEITIHPQQKIFQFLSRKYENNIKIYHYLYDNATIFLDRKKETADQILNIIPYKNFFNKEELIISFEKYKDSKFVAKEFKCSVSIINRAVLDLNIREDIDKIILPQKTVIWRSTSQEQIKKDLAELGSIDKVAQKYNVSKCSVRRKL